MFTARAFWITRRSAGLECGSVPPVFTATLISLLMRENALDMRSQRANIVCLRTSNMRPIRREFSHAPGGGVPESESARSGSGIRHDGRQRDERRDAMMLLAPGEPEAMA